MDIDSNYKTIENKIDKIFKLISTLSFDQWESIKRHIDNHMYEKYIVFSFNNLNK